MSLFKFYLQNAAAPYSPATKRGEWDATWDFDKKLGTTKFGAMSGVSGDIGSTEYHYNRFYARFVSEPLASDMQFSGPVSGVLGLAEDSLDLNAYTHVHLYVLIGQTDVLRATLWEDYIDGDEISDAFATGGQAIAGTLNDVNAILGDTVVLEVGVRASSDLITHETTVYFGGVGADLADGGNAWTDTGWIELTYTIAVGRSVQLLWNTIACAGSEVQVLWNIACPIVSLVTPTDGGILQGLTPLFVFGTDNYDGNDVHVNLQVSAFADFRSYVIDTDTTVDFLDWEEAIAPFTTWTVMGAGGATEGNRVRYTTLDPLRYDTYYGRVWLADLVQAVISGVVCFSFTVIADASLPLAVTVGGTGFQVGDCRIVENTDGEASPLELEIPLSAFLVHPLTQGDPVAIASGLGGWDRTWNGTVETWTFSGSVVTVHCLQDDAYVSRKLVTGDEGAADLGANLFAFVDDYGTPLSGANIDVATGIVMALTGGHKYLREHFTDALKALPNYLYWVDWTGDVHLVDQTSLPYSPIELYEETP